MCRDWRPGTRCKEGKKKRNSKQVTLSCLDKERAILKMLRCSQARTGPWFNKTCYTGTRKTNHSWLTFVLFADDCTLFLRSGLFQMFYLMRRGPTLNKRKIMKMKVSSVKKAWLNLLHSSWPKMGAWARTHTHTPLALPQLNNWQWFRCILILEELTWFPPLKMENIGKD